MEPSITKRRCIIVAGMHRSGTSALARLINLLGVHISQELMPAAQGNNDRGFWEPMEVVRIHDELLSALGSSWDDPLPLHDGWLQQPAAKHAKQRLGEELDRDFRNSEIFIVKDPRIPRILPLWLELLDELKVEPLIAITVRNPLEVAQSLEKRDKFSRDKSILLYVQSYLDVELYSRGRPRVFISYERLLQNWRPVVDALQAFASTGKINGAIERQIANFLSSELRHNRVSEAELKDVADIPRMVVRMFDLMSGFDERGNDSELRRSFDQFREIFVESRRLFGDLLVSERRECQRRAEDEAVAHIRERDATLVEHQAELEQRDKRIAALEAECVVHAAQLSMEKEENAGVRRTLAEKDAQIATLNISLSSRHAENASLRQVAAERETSIEKLDIMLAERARLLIESDAQIGELRAVLSVREAERRAAEEADRTRTAQITKEIVTLTRFLREKEDDAAWLHLVATTLVGDSRRGRLASLLPAPVASMFRNIQLRRRNLFDAAAYLRANPDVARVGGDPLRHYIIHGLKERRARR